MVAGGGSIRVYRGVDVCGGWGGIELVAWRGWGDQGAPGRGGGAEWVGSCGRESSCRTAARSAPAPATAALQKQSIGAAPPAEVCSPHPTNPSHPPNLLPLGCSLPRLHSSLVWSCCAPPPGTTECLGATVPTCIGEALEDLVGCEEPAAVPVVHHKGVLGGHDELRGQSEGRQAG